MNLKLKLMEEAIKYLEKIKRREEIESELFGSINQHGKGLKHHKNALILGEAILILKKRNEP